ncbi:hypothetical protein SB719_20295, partial [Pantoea sp. SIMBA_079]|uniref:hypothetical protein n=1 Tax=Pantoea sp. SIMBA_079 TaxID=3085817 RepID=UPI003995C64E
DAIAAQAIWGLQKSCAPLLTPRPRVSRFHSEYHSPWACDFSAGAGLPAKRPVQAAKVWSRLCHLRIQKDVAMLKIWGRKNSSNVRKALW